MSNDSNQPQQACCGCSENEVLGAANWQARYVAGETGWDRGEPSPALVHWLATQQLNPCRILVPGCGRGHEVVELAARGFEVTAIDFADAPVAVLNEQLASRGLSADVKQVDFFDFRPTEPFDAIYEQTCLCAIDPKGRDAYEQQLATCLRPSGQLFALFMQSGKMVDGPPFPCSMEDMQTLFDASRWEWPAAQQTIEHPAGLKEMAVILRRKIP